MKLTITLLCLFAFLSTTLIAQENEVPSKDDQIAMAVLAAPEDQREAATVKGYNAEGEMITLREGTNNLICVSDNPSKEGFQVVCYHNALVPFMNRGDELRAEGKKPKEIFDIREAEAKAGTLQMPENPSTLHVFSGKDAEYNAETGEVTGANYRYVVYIPWATAESTGLPTKPMQPGGAWIMDPGTHRAHIMVTPPRK